MFWFHSKTSAPSCIASIIHAPTNLYGIQLSATSMAITWDTSHQDCICSYTLYVSTSASNYTISSILPTQNPYILCNLPMNSTIHLQLIPSNLYTTTALPSITSTLLFKMDETWNEYVNISNTCSTTAMVC